MIDLAPPPLIFPSHFEGKRPAIIRPEVDPLRYFPVRVNRAERRAVQAELLKAGRLEAMLPGMVPVITGGQQPLTLTQKGYGYAAINSAGNLTLNYSTVSAGSAPAAGDLVVWILEVYDVAANDLTGSGWAQERVTSSVNGTVLAKIVVSGDISSPPILSTYSYAGGAGAWVAYTISRPADVAVGGTSMSYSSGAPSNQSLNLSALSGPLVALALAAGSDGSITNTWSGATPTGGVTANNVFRSGQGDIYVRWLDYAEGVPGDSITVSKSDDGNDNVLIVGYVSLS